MFIVARCHCKIYSKVRAEFLCGKESLTVACILLISIYINARMECNYKSFLPTDTMQNKKKEQLTSTLDTH